ncbi:hypothetical protein F5148DRAFT_165934 [Russula earlei]|uniref:Uncharacterized protein n=1 Tax=Russula earlei TaxID=71964 RepID=A0ACC0U5V0_9AGAM|nr:hypothetical protein F5148DRAFT_165934 [Russula earlei]
MSTLIEERMHSLDPFSAAESAIAIQMERMRAAEAVAARDVIAQHLSLACRSIRDKSAIIDTLRQQNKHLEDVLKEHTSPHELPNSLLALPSEVPTPAGQETPSVIMMADNPKTESSAPKGSPLSNTAVEEEPPKYEVTEAVSQTPEGETPSTRQDALRLLREATFNSLARVNSPRVDTPDTPATPKMIVSDLNDLDIKVVADPHSEHPRAEESIAARHAILAALPLPPGIPSDALRPILIPSAHTLQEFFACAAGPLRAALANHRIFQQSTTNWCPEREEHGYFLTPLFKCATNPRVSTAHCWTMVDVISKLDKPTECFYNKDGKWYYAGVYRAIRLDDLTTKEFEQLSTETTQSLVKETLAGRKNVSPQTVYETSQLYLAGLSSIKQRGVHKLAVGVVRLALISV